MNKSILFITSAVILLAGCAKVEDQNNEVVPENGKHIVTLRAKVDESNTRVSIDGAGNYSWQDNDEIDVLTSGGQFAWGYINDNYGTTADFYVELYDDASLGQYAYYPSAERSWNDDYTDPNVFVLNSYYNYQKDVSFMPMLGTISSNGATFKSVGGVLKVPINNIPIDAHLLQVYVEGKRVTGGFPITVVNGNKQINAEPFPEGGDCIYIRFWGSDDVDSDPEVGNGANNRVFYIPLPCGIYNNLEFSIYENEPDESGLLFTRTATIAGGLEVERNDIITAKALDVVIEKNTPDRIEFEGPYDYTLDENSVLHLDQYDTPIDMVARIYGKNENKPVEDVDEDLISCILVNVTDPDNVVEEDEIEFDYDLYSGVTMTFPTDVAGEFKLKVYYDKDGDNPLSAESCTFKVHEAAPLPESLSTAKWNLYSYSSWFNQYRFKNPLDDTDETTYLKTYKASLLEALPVNAFRNSFNTISESFEAFACFSSITSIPDNAFNACVDMTGISIPSGVTSIGNSAFAACRALDGIELPEGVTSIGNSAFKECDKLSSLHLPSGVTSIGANTFNSCTRLKSINLDNVLSIGVSAFVDCDNLTEVVIGDASIGTEAFNGCENLQSVTIGTLNSNGTASIGYGAFAGCESLSDVNLVSVSSIGDFAFYFCSLNSITLSNNLTTIGVSAFQGSGLKAITIPDSVTSIGDYAFAYCYSLEYVEFKSSTPPTIEDVASCFYFAEGDPVPNFKIYVPADENVVSAYKSAWPALQDRIKAKPAN